MVSEVMAAAKAMSAAEAVTKAMAATAMSAAKAMSTAMSSMGSCQRSANWKYQRCKHGGGDSKIFLSLHKRLQTLVIAVWDDHPLTSVLLRVH